MEDALWTLAQQSRALQGLRGDVAGFWVDNAARYINSRFLDLHEDDDRHLRDQLGQQHTALIASRASVTQANDCARVADRYAQEIVDWLDQAANEERMARLHHDLFARYDGKARDALPEIDHLMRLANAACPG